MTTVHGVKNVKDIAILSYDSKDHGYIITADAFLSRLYEENGNDDSDRNQCTKDVYKPKKAYKTDMFWICGNDENCQKNHGAIHDNDDMYQGCTKFYNLYGNDRMTIEKEKLKNMGFKIFDNNRDSSKNWIVIPKGGLKYDLYWRVYYRTWNDYLDYIKCNSNNLNLDNYNKNTDECKTYITDNNKQQWIANTCVREKISESDLFGICNQQLGSDKVNNAEKEEIIKKQMEWCKQNNNLKDNDNCLKFWGLDYKSPYYTETMKSTMFDVNKWVTNKYCQPGFSKSADNKHKQFCACLNNEQNEVYYTDANGNKMKVPDMCLFESCSSNSYKPANYKDYKCPDQCIQIADVKYGSLQNVQQSCTINQAEQTKKTDIAEESNNLIPGVGTIIDNNVPKDKSKSSLFNLQNDNIKSFMNQLNVNTIETSSYLLNEEDIFILGIIFIFILLFIISKVTGGKSEPNYSYYPNQMYYDSYPNQIYYDSYPNQIY